MRLPQRIVPRTSLAGPALMMLAIQIPLIWAGPLFTVFGSIGGVASAGYPWLAIPAGAMIFALQLRHSFAMASGRRPRGGIWTLLALAVLAYAPLHWLGIDWVSEQFVLMGSILMVLGGWLAAAALTGPCIYLAIEFGRVFPAHPGPATPADYLNWVTYYVVGALVDIAALYGSARLVWMARELRDTRIALAGAAVGRQRLQVSRDVHDLLGHSLAAISLKGDLATRLLRRDSPAAVTEIRNLTQVAREALADLRTITGGGKVTLAGELDNARALLAAAGVAVAFRGDASAIPPAAGEALAWTVREGVTNILRHATASTAKITLERRDGAARLEMINDGAVAGTRVNGNGLTGLAGRIEELSGTLSHGRLNENRFHLTAQVPVIAFEEPSWTASGSSSQKTST